jgi:hypothetical protein
LQSALRVVEAIEAKHKAQGQSADSSPRAAE